MLKHDYGHGKSKQKYARSRRRDSAVLSMPDMFKPTELQYTSPITKFQTFKVEDNNATGQVLYMKAIKNQRCVILQLKHELDKQRNLDHPNLPKIPYVTFSDYYSYVVFERPHGKPLYEDNNNKIWKEKECRSIIYQIARAMQYTHAFGNIHRDLRDTNIFIDYPKHHDNRPKVTLVDFGSTKALQADQKLAILEDGSGFASAHVRQKYGQYPAPEVLMDFRIDRNVDSWFLGILIYRMICGKIPFENAETDEQIRDAILHDTLSFDNENWVHISAPLDELVRGLLIKDAKRRFTIDHIFWSRWIRKIKYDNIAKLVIAYWLQKYELEISSNIMTMIDAYTSCGLTAIQLPQYPDPIDEPQYKSRIKQQFRLRKKFEKLRSRQLTFHNDSRSVIHQTKIYDIMNANPYISSECFLTISANVWCSPKLNPIIFEFRLDYVKNDIFIGIISDQYHESESYMHHIGSDDESIGISLRECISYYNNQSQKSLQRNDYMYKYNAYTTSNSNITKSNTNIINSTKNKINEHNINENKNDNSNNQNSSNNNNLSNGHRNNNNTNSNDHNNEIDSPTIITRNINNPATNFYNLQGSRTSYASPTSGMSWLQKENNKMSGPPPIRKMIVKLRIDCVSRCLSLLINDREVLDPLYFEFTGKVAAAFTLTHCMDQVTLRNVDMEMTP